MKNKKVGQKTVKKEIKNQNSKPEQKKEIMKIILNILLVGAILCIILAITLYIIEIRKILPAILILVLASIISLAMYFLCRNIMKQQNAKKRKVIIKNNA